MKKYVDGVLMDMSADEISARETEITTNTQAYNERVVAKQSKEDLKASAKAKLIAGEALTEEEANTIVL